MEWMLMRECLIAYLLQQCLVVLVMVVVVLEW